MRTILLLPALLAGLGLAPSPRVEAQPYTNLYNFAFGDDGANPNAGLIAANNTLYGTADLGGSFGSGVVYKVNADGSGFTILHAFSTHVGIFFTNSDGVEPVASLALAGNTLYGTTSEGGPTGFGTLFKVNTDGSGFVNLHSFSAFSAAGTNSDGAYPFGNLIVSGGTLYGTTTGGGFFGNGTVFAMNTNGTGFSTLHSFNPPGDGSEAVGGLILSGGTLYGTTQYGGTATNGTVFKIGNDGTGYTILHNFTALSGANATNNDGGQPQGGLLLLGTNLYGTAFQGGAAGSGSIFRMGIGGAGFTTLYSFSAGTAAFPNITNSDGANPTCTLVSVSNILYGTAYMAGPAGVGTLFSLNTNGTGFTILYGFPGGGSGANPYAGMVLMNNKLYGTTLNGGTFNHGAVFGAASPTLGIAQAGNNQIVLFWPAWATNYVLQSTTNVSGSNWANVSILQPIIGAIVTNGSPKAFFRLEAP